MDANQKSEPGIVRSTKHYDSWLLALEPAFEHDSKQKLKVMAGVPGDFLRATFYRWSERFPDVCLEVISAPSVGAVGDVHVGNFGTWPCSEGRLRWGLNDFDEAGWMPFTNDLVRLATSALLARSDLDPEVVGRTILSGYSQRLRGGEFGALDIAGDAHLRASAAAARPSAEAFFGKLAGKDELDADDARRLTRLRERLGEAVPGGKFHHRRAGRGSLGRVRVFVLGGEPPVAVEAKRVLRSAWSWARRDGHADPTAGDDRNGRPRAWLATESSRCHERGHRDRLRSLDKTPRGCRQGNRRRPPVTSLVLFSRLRRTKLSGGSRAGTVTDVATSQSRDQLSYLHLKGRTNNERDRQR